jgi:hypothetical protein
MDSTDNKKLIRHVFGELVSGNPRPLLEIMADDFRFVITGRVVAGLRRQAGCARRAVYAVDGGD